MTLDAPHCNPQTTAQMHQAGGQYVIQVKENQPLLLTQCQHVAATAVPLGSHDACEKGHGRLTTREGQCFDMRALSLAPRWSDSGVHTLVVMKRHTLTLTTQKTTCETAYYISNQARNTDPQAQAMALTGAIRQHWHVESDNWIRDVTFDEDNVKTTSANQAQGMGCLRSLAMRLLRRFDVKNSSVVFCHLRCQHDILRPYPVLWVKGQTSHAASHRSSRAHRHRPRGHLSRSL